MRKLFKILTLLLLIVTPTVLAACNNTYRDIKIVASSLENERSISMYVGEEKELVFNVYNLPKNASGRLHFTRDDSTISQPVLVRYNQTDNENVIKFTAISYGTTNIRAVAEGGNTISVEVKVFEEITNFSLKNELVLVKGDSARSSIKLNSGLFNFYPESTNQTALEFTNQENEVIDKINLEDYEDQTEVVIKARSPYLNQTIEIAVKIIDEIRPFNFYADETLLVANEQKTSESQVSKIYLSSNKKEEFSYRKLQAVIENENNLIDAKIVPNPSSKVLVVFDEQKREIIEGNTVFNFVISVGGLDVGEEDIVFEAYYINVDENVYKVTRTFKVIILEYPNKIFVNNVGLENLETTILHAGYYQEITTDIKIDIYPLYAKIDRVEISYNALNLGPTADMFEYIEFKQNNQILNENTIDLSLPIVARGIKTTENQKVWLNLKIFYGSEFNEEEFEIVEIPLEVKSGASQLHLEQDWSDGLIYVYQNENPIIFNGLYANELSAYLNDVSVKNLTSLSSQIAKIVPQNESEENIDFENNKKYLPLKIYPLSTGQARFNIVLANGVSKQLRVEVVPKLSSFKIDYDKSVSSPVTLAKYDENKNIEQLSMQMQERDGGTFIKTKFNFSADIENYLSLYTKYYKLSHTEDENYIYDKELRILTTNNLGANPINNGNLITFTLHTFKIENFKLIDTSNPELTEEEKQGFEFVYNIKFDAFLPLSNISFSNSQLSLFSESELGIYYKTEASKTTQLNFYPENVKQVFDTITPNSNSNPNIKLEYYVANIDSTYNNDVLSINQYGTYNVKTGVFTLDYKAGSIAPFDVFAKATYYGKVYISKFTVIPKEYILPTSIQFSDYVDSIYLDATRPITEINMYMLPNNVTHTAIEYDFEASPGLDSTAIKISISNNNTKLTVSYDSNKIDNSHTDLSGVIVLKPRASIVDSLTPPNSRRIQIKIGVGSFDAPFQIYTAEQLLNINVTGLDKHYKIMNKIDLSHITNFKPIGKFTGSLQGENSLSEISGIKISGMIEKNKNAGLFTSIEPQTNSSGIVENTGLIKNLKISGSLNLTLSSSANIGLVAGTLASDAVLENVSVTLTASTVTVSTLEEVKIGAVVGNNQGIIKTIIKSDTKHFASLLTGLGTLTVNYTLNTKGVKSFVGGATGLNDETGTITRIVQEEDVKLYNLSNHYINLNLDLKEDYPGFLNFSIGMIAGKNLAQITAQKIIEDEIKNLDNIDFTDYIKLGGKIRVLNQSNNIIGGIVGENQTAKVDNLAQLKGIVSRVKILSNGNRAQNADAYFGGMFGINNGGIISDLVLQATEDATSLGVNASMLYLTHFGREPNEAQRVGIFGFDASLSRQINEDDNLNLFAQTFMGAEEENPPSTRRKFVQRDVSPALNNYYGDFVIGQTKHSEEDEEKRTAIKFMPVDANFLIDEQNINNRLIPQEASSILMTYLKLYKAQNSADQHLLETKNIYDFPFNTMGEILLISLNSDIISILNDGLLKVNKTGLVAIQVYSLLNRKVIKTVHILVTYAFDNYTLLLNNIFENDVNNANDISVFAGSAVTLVPQIKAKQDFDGYIINYVASTDLIFENINENNNPSVVFEKVGGNYILRAVDNPGKQTVFNLEVKVFYDYNGVLFKAEQPEEKTINFNATYMIGATKVSLSSGRLEIEPIEKTDVIIEISTDKFDDDVSIKQFKENEENNNFILQEKNRFYNISVNPGINEFYENNENQDLQVKLNITQKNVGTDDEQTYSLILSINLETRTFIISEENFADLWLDLSNYFFIDKDQTYTYSLEAFIEDNQVSLNSILKLNKIQKLMSVQYDQEKLSNESNDYTGNYFIAFASKSNFEVGAELFVKINSQSVGNITIASFEGSQNLDIATGKQEYNFVDPMARNKNHFKISVYPLQADYDYIKIEAGINPNTSNQINTIFTLLNSDGTSKAGAKNISNGLIINKSLIDGDVFVRYSVEMLNLFNDDNISFILSAYKNDTVIYLTDKMIKVKFKQDVTIEIENKQEKDGVIYVTRGSSYRFNLSANGYRDSEVVIETTSIPLASLINISISTRTLTITSNTISYPINNQKIDLLVYGRKIVNGEVVESAPQEISLVVVEYLILENQEYAPIKRASGKIASVSIGDIFTFEAEFILGQTVEYQPAITSIPSAVKVFETSITNQGTWQYQMGMLNSDGEYEYSNAGWINLSQNIELAQTDGYFTITQKNNLYVFTPHKVLNIENAPYKFKFTYGYDYVSGKAEFKAGGNMAEHEFLINVYQMSAIESPTPIYTFSQLQSMNPGSYYILMNDIALPSNFTPIETEIGGLDGNNNKIILNSNIAFETSKEFAGLFTVIGENTLIRNINFEITSNVVLRLVKTGTQSVYFGLLAGQNNGMITNISVKSVAESNLRVVFSEPQNSSINYVSALVGHNSLKGAITHSRVEISLYSSSSLAGFVGYNRGKISNSYVNNSLIVNTSGRLENKTAGFVVINAGQDGQFGQIIASYVSGVSTNFAIYANSANRVIQSSREVGGFVYENSGLISDSYSNIPIGASSNSAGFVYTNYGTIQNSYSTSLMKETSEGTYGFIKTNYGTLINNHFLKDEGVNDTINNSNNYIEGAENTYQKSELFQLTVEEFGQAKSSEEGYFESYVFTNSNALGKGVWFYPKMSLETQFNNNLKTFTLGRPELVQANLVAVSSLEIDFDRTIENTQTGEVDYVYKNVGEFYQGSVYNPIIISTAQEFETKIIQSSSGLINTDNFRIVNNLDYGQDTTSSNLYKYIFAGEIEGNGMEISNYVINTSANIATAGLFAKIGVGTSGQGSIKNLILKPAYINLPNTNAVGALAGTIESATLFNIEVDGETTTDTTLMIIGKNLVGGLFGRATGNYVLKNISSNISVTATFRSAISINPDNPQTTDKIGSYFLFKSHTSDILSKLSYSGAVGGVLAGKGKASFISVDGNVVSNSEWASLVFGGVGDGVLIQNVNISINQNQIIQASAYAGTAVAEFYGKMENVNILSLNDSLDNLFRTVTYKPYGIGGVVGLMGTNENITIGQNGARAYDGESGLYNVQANLNILSLQAKIVGGIVAQMIGGNLENATFKGSITSGLTAGGIVGAITQVADAPINLFGAELDKSSTAISLKNLKVLGRNSQSGIIRVDNDNVGFGTVGGAVGVFETFTNSLENIVIENVVVDNQVRMSSIIYGGDFSGIRVGGLIGWLKVSNDKTLEIKNSHFNNRIVISLRNLNFHPATFASNYISYGFMIGNIEKDGEFNNGDGIAIIENSSSLNATIHYSGAVGNTGHYILFNYIQNGVSKSYAPTPENNIYKVITLSNE